VTSNGVTSSSCWIVRVTSEALAASVGLDQSVRVTEQARVGGAAVAGLAT